MGGHTERSATTCARSWEDPNVETKTETPRPGGKLPYRAWLCQDMRQSREHLGWTTEQAALAFGITKAIYEEIESGADWVSEEHLFHKAQLLTSCWLPQLMIHRAEGRATGDDTAQRINLQSIIDRAAGVLAEAKTQTG